MALNLEVTPMCLGRIEPDNDVLIYTNHFFAKDMLPLEQTIDSLIINSKLRFPRIQRLLMHHRGSLDDKVFQEIFPDRACHPDYICNPKAQIWRTLDRCRFAK